MSIITQETVINLADRGIPTDSFRFGKTTIESDKYICTAATSPEGKSQVVCIDMQDNNKETRKPSGGDAFLMNTVDNIMAVRGSSDSPPGVGVQVFDLNSKTKLGNFTFPSVVFWRWLAPRTLAIVTDTSVYHWNVSVPTNEPVKVFDRKETCAEPSSQIIAYTVDSNTDMTVDAEGKVSNCKWCLLTALHPGENNSIEGAMMLYSIPLGAYQKLTGHAGCFGSIQLEDNGPARELVAFFQHDAASGHKLIIMPRPQTPAANVVKKISVPVRYENDQHNDFPVAMHMSEKLGVIFAITKQAFCYVFDVATGTLLSRQKIGSDPIFLVAPNSKTGGVLAVTRKGLVLSIGINDQTLIPYIKNQLGLPQVAVSLSVRYGYAGNDEALIEQFKSAFAQGDYKTATTIAAKLKSGALRTPHVIQQFKSAPTGPDGSKPINTYFQTLLDLGKLNRHESLEIAHLIASGGHITILERWIREDKLELSAELADIVKPVNPALAAEVLLKVGAHSRVIQALMERGAYDQVVPYARQHNTQIDTDGLLRACLTTRPDLISAVASELLNPEVPPLADPLAIFNLLVQSGKIIEGCGALFKFLRPNRPDQGNLQTRLLQVAIQHHREGAKSIFQTKSLTYYDRNAIAQDCERAGLIQLALEHHTDLAAIRRCMLMGGHQLTIEWLTNFLNNQSPENILEILSDMLKASKANSQIVFQAALKFQDRVGATKFANVFESQGQSDVCFHFLKTIVSTSQDPDVHYKFIEVGCKLNQVSDVETFIRQDPSIYDPVKVKDLLKEVRLPNHRPLIHVCDRNGFIEELTEYLYKYDSGSDSSALSFLKIYVLQVNTSYAPTVLGTLIDLDCGEDFITDILNNLHPNSCPTDKLVEAFERRSRLKLLLPFLERAQANPEPAVHNALAKIYIDTNRDAETFLTNNSLYNPKVIGDYCADRDPHLACVAYKRYPGKCDDELIAVANKNGLYRMLARYCVERQDPNLWAKVLCVDNEHREGLVDCVTSTALPESNVEMEVNVAVKAFIAADIPHHLMDLVEKIVLHNPTFQGAANLQSLLILTAIKTDPPRVMDYINRLDSYEGKEIAKIAASEKYKLYEEALAIYVKFNMNVEAVEILLNQLDSISRATEFAERVSNSQDSQSDASAVWAKVAKAELAQSRVSAAVDGYIRANVATDYSDVIEAAEREEAFDDLVRFCRMVREKTSLKNSDVDSALVYALARTDSLTEDFFSSTGGAGSANLQDVGDRLFREGYFRPARLVFAVIPNNARLASCYVMLEDFAAALEAAKKAKNPKVWKEVCLACVATGEFKLAQIAGQHVITQPDHLDELVKHYERAGYIDQLIDLLDSGLASESAHPGLFTELGILYVKHRPSALRQFTELYTKRLNIPKLIRVCEKYALWKDVVLLHTAYGEFDQAVQVTLAHPASAWEEKPFEDALKKVSNGELLYRAATFYLDEHPLKLSKLLIAVSSKLDHARMVNVLKRGGGLNALALVNQSFTAPNPANPTKGTIQHIGYLRYIWDKLDLNLREVNETVIELFLEEGNFSTPVSENPDETGIAAVGGGLREFIARKDNFDQVGLAGRLEKNTLLAARRTAALLYRSNGHFKKSLELSRKDGAFKDVIDTARASGKPELVEDLLRQFSDTGAEECFAATLYVCYEFIKADLVMELAWRNGWDNAAKPYFIQQSRDQSNRIEAAEKALSEAKKNGGVVGGAAASVNMGNAPLPNQLGAFPGQLALGGPAPGYPTPGFGF